MRPITACLVLTAMMLLLFAQTSAAEPESTNLLTFSRIEKAQALANGEGTIVAVLDWLFDIKGKAGSKYIHPTSLIENEPIGELEPWHGEWMAGIVHAIAPAAKIIPIKARGKDKSDPEAYERHIITGIRLAADHGAVAVCSSMGPLAHTPDLLAAIEYAEERGTIFIDVHPEYVIDELGERQFGKEGEFSRLIIHPGPVSVPDHPAETNPARDIYTWPYDLDAVFKDGWGYSNCPPTVAGTIALMRSVNPELTNAEVRQIIVETGNLREGFKVLDAEAAVKAALAQK